jgi:hypothetical protein
LRAIRSALSAGSPSTGLMHRPADTEFRSVRRRGPGAGQITPLELIRSNARIIIL